jgi:hypothetical protein
MRDPIDSYLLEEHRSKPFDEHFVRPSEYCPTAKEVILRSYRRADKITKGKNNA